MLKLLPLLLLLVGAGAGIAAGHFMAPEPALDGAVKANATPSDPGEETGETEFVKLNNQFVVPVVLNEKVASLIVMSLSIEVETGGQEAVFSHEPRLRDAFLQVMFEHANMGGFNGAFTATSNMRLLREALKQAADDVMQGHITDVLIVDIVRQDVTN